jgi:TRAP transporter 4TM/12TM fusion protein
MADRREIGGREALAVTALAVGASCFHIYTTWAGFLEPRLQRAVHLGFLLPLAFLLYPATAKSPKDRPSVWDWIWAALGFLANAYIVWQQPRIQLRWEGSTALLFGELFWGTVITLLLLEATRRAVSPWLFWLVAVFLGYLFAGPYLPGILHHKGFTYGGAVDLMYLYSEQGIYGSLTGISATVIFIFVLFGCFIIRTGLGQFFTDLSVALAGRTRGGPAKVAVVSSALYGTLSGSSVSNVYTTGSFSIPLMKQVGYRAQFAGAVEAAAGVGGMIMPPIMGVGAFVMAEMTAIPYWTIAKSAALAAILYYLGVFAMVHLEAVKMGLRPMAPSEIPPLRTVLPKSYLLSPIILLVVLLVMGYTPVFSGMLAIVVSVAVAAFRSDTRMGPRAVWQALRQGGCDAAMIAVAIAAAGMIVAVIAQTALGLAFSSLFISLSGGWLLLTLIMVMIVDTFLGTGIPTTPSYILTVVVGGAAMMKLGVGLLPAHLFAFYYGVLADITPPVAIAAYASAAIAGSEPMKTGFEAFKLAIGGFIVPFIFVYHPALILQGAWHETLWAFVVAAACILLTSAALTGWFLGPAPWPERILLLLSAAGLVATSHRVVAGAAAVAVGCAIWHVTQQRRTRESSG